eukprot:3666143-Rhodomonas_salina.3
MSGTHVAYAATGCYAMSGTGTGTRGDAHDRSDAQRGDSLLPVCPYPISCTETVYSYSMSGTETVWSYAMPGTETAFEGMLLRAGGCVSAL